MRAKTLFLALSLLAATLLLAQTEPPRAQYAEEIEVRVIDVDVVVTDRHGNPLTNLTRDDFELYENGRRVDIAYFSRIVDGHLADVPPAPQPSEATAAPAPTPPAPRTPLTWVVYVDQTNLAPQRRNQALRQIQTFLRSSMKAGDRAVVAHNDGRSFRLRQGLTEDPQLVVSTLAAIEKERFTVTPTTAGTATLRGRMMRVRPNDNNPGCPYHAQSAANDVSAVIDEEAFRTRNAILAMSALLDGMSTLEGRVALVYLGAGFNTVPALQLVEYWNAQFTAFQNETWAPDPDVHRGALEAELARLYANLSAQRVTVYTVHGGELAGNVTPVEDEGHTEPSAATPGDRAKLTEAGLAREMAERTGGVYFKVSQALATQMESVRRDLSNYYSLGYKPAGQIGKERHIRVKVRADGARVRHRETVRERTRQERAAGAVIAATVQPLPTVQRAALRTPVPAGDVTAANPLGVKIEAEKPRPDGWTKDFLLPFRFSIQLESLTFVEEAGVHRAFFTMHFTLVGKDGSVYPLDSRQQTLAIPQNEIASADGPMNYAWHVDLAPLKIPAHIPVKQDGMRLTVSVEDRTSGTRSVLTVPLGAEIAKVRG